MTFNNEVGIAGFAVFITAYYFAGLNGAIAVTTAHFVAHAIMTEENSMKVGKFP